MDKLKNLGDKLKHGATEFADKHELKAKAEELKEKAEETVVQLTHPGSGQMDTAGAIAAANIEGGAVSSTARTTEEEDEKEKLKLEIAQLGGSITSVKTNTEDKSEMKKILDPLVTKLLAAKAKFAAMNNGIGVDGKPHGGKKTKEKKKEKLPSEQQHVASNLLATAESAAKKAAKKAEKAAKKAAYKAGLIDSVTGGSMTKSGSSAQEIVPVNDAPGATSEGGGAAGGGGNKGKPAVVNVASKAKGNSGDGGGTTAATAIAVVNKPSSSSRGGKNGGPPPLTNLSKYKLKPLQLVINPNVERMNERPIITLAVACVCDIDIDLTITSDHRISQPMLGMLGDGDGKGIVGDLASARYLLDGVVSASSPYNVLATATPEQRGEQNAWIEYAQSLMQLAPEQALKGIAMTLEHALSTRTYLCGYTLTLADIVLFAALGFPCTSQDQTHVLEALADYPVATRWTRMLCSHPALQKATQLAVGAAGTTEAEAQFIADSEYHLAPLVSGMNLLEGAIPGQVVTRFPPEPSGYLHVGHAKACLLNDYYARRYKGRLIIRFDDTNPSKEKEEYQQSILEDLHTLGVKGDVLTYTSDYIDVIRQYALQLIAAGQAYMDDTPQEQMKEERAARIASTHRNPDNQSPAAAKTLFDEMCAGSEAGSKWCLRAKMDMTSDNGTMRDPVLYRQNLTPHHRTGTTHKAYPTYDLACPIVDSLEGVTHALRTTEYNDRDEQYQYLQKILHLRRVRIHSFCRMNFQYTVLSKRKLAWFVQEQLVDGWDDARFPTVRGVVRRGVSIPALKTYIYGQGASRRVVNMVWNNFWSENKKELDKTARRFMAIDATSNATLTITNFPAAGKNVEGNNNEVYTSTSLHPKDPSLGQRPLRLSSIVLLETVDADDCVVGENIVLLRWGVVKITHKDRIAGTVMVHGELVPEGDFKACGKRKYSWIALADLGEEVGHHNEQVYAQNCPALITEFDYLVTKEKLEDGDDFAEYVNPTTIATTTVIGDVNLKTLQAGEVIQLERRGFYRVDQPYRRSVDKPIVLYMIPDGKTKSMSGMTGKLQHH
mmetsp:Transcript_16484/g.19023  ORF Transcript_16484/g.19023 Transcript_16484/m.19023 type:complete len:1058 (+) Transcript_16484:153-3326(+)